MIGCMSVENVLHESMRGKMVLR